MVSDPHKVQMISKRIFNSLAGQLQDNLEWRARSARLDGVRGRAPTSCGPAAETGASEASASAEGTGPKARSGERKEDSRRIRGGFVDRYLLVDPVEFPWSEVGARGNWQSEKWAYLFVHALYGPFFAIRRRSRCFNFCDSDSECESLFSRDCHWSISSLAFAFQFLRLSL